MYLTCVRFYSEKKKKKDVLDLVWIPLPESVFWFFFFNFFEKSVSYDYAFSGSRVLFTVTINLFFQKNFH